VSRPPIRLRVAAAFALAMSVVLAATGAFLYLRLSSHLSLAVDRELRLRTQDLAVLLARNISLEQDSGSRFVERGESYAQLVGSNGRVIEATRPLGRAPLLTSSQLVEAWRAPLYLDKPDVPGLNEGSRLLARRVGVNVLVVGTTLQDRAETLASFRDELLIAGPLALILATGVGYLLAGISLRQVESMRVRAAAISAETPGERLPVPRTHDEIERLGTTLNEMLDRLQAGLERERSFVADAGHELRTPIALLRTELEVALRQADSVEELRDALDHASVEADRLAHLADDLLLIARSDRGALPLRVERVDAKRLFASVLSRSERGLDGKRVDAKVPPGFELRADSLRLEQALGNLVDNAARYGGDEIRLEAVRVDGRTELHVRDNGGGFPPGFLDRAFERFARADAARGRGGAGLGLSIVRTIAEAHGGEAHAANVQPWGADVWVALPD
jgi:signal transduction histidine kinase